MCLEQILTKTPRPLITRPLLDNGTLRLDQPKLLQAES